MSRHHATIDWLRQSKGFSYPEYNRDHEWIFAGNVRVPASAAPAYLGSETRVDPEEAFVAAVASCHMLTFLAICARRGLVVERYRDDAVGYLEKNPAGRLAVTRVELSPEIEFAGGALDDDTLAELHHRAHEQCFIANSINTRVSVMPRN